MSAQIFTTYVSTHLMVCVGVGLTWLFFFLLRSIGKSVAPGTELKFHYVVFSAVLLMSFVQLLLPKNDLVEPIAKIWVARSEKELSAIPRAKAQTGFVSLDTRAAATMVPVESASRALEVFLLAIVGYGVIRFATDLKRIHDLRARSFLIRKIGALCVYVSEETLVPFSFWLPWRKIVVLPQLLIGTRDSKIALQHEIQHHRQGDTKWVYITRLAKLLFILNPLIHIWERTISDLQELACDEAILNKKRVDPQAYAACLIHVAELANAQVAPLACATGLIFVPDRKTLKRRIKTMLEEKQPRIGLKLILPSLMAVSLAVGVTAFASQGLIKDRRVGVMQAQEMAAVAQRNSDFPIVVNDRVVKWLNYFLGTPEGRVRAKQALVRMESYKPLIGSKLSQYGLPDELMAIPLIEAGYQNLASKKNPVGAAGLWQFMAKTAQNFGLRVDETIDERLDASLSTDAALRLLLADKLRFKDWQLSILAYNAGETAVQNAIFHTGSRDPWELVRTGLGSDEANNYLPKLMAAILIMKNPDSVQ